ncbi:MAG: replication-relaxation family protein [Actinomycetota bacterium]
MTGPPLGPRRRRRGGPLGGPAGTRAARPSRVPLRSRSRGSQILTYAHRIQERDIEILFDLYEHRVLTTRQIRDLHFNCYRVASRRLLSLFELDLVTRFRPPRRTGSHPYHYTLEEPGALIVATRLDLALKQTGFRRDTPKRFAKSFWLDHWVETNDFFCRLAWALTQGLCPACPDTQLQAARGTSGSYCNCCGSRWSLGEERYVAERAGPKLEPL